MKYLQKETFLSETCYLVLEKYFDPSTTLPYNQNDKIKGLGIEKCAIVNRCCDFLKLFIYLLDTSSTSDVSD